jgi:hypothetical protein
VKGEWWLWWRRRKGRGGSGGDGGGGGPMCDVNVSNLMLISLFSI